MQSRLEKMTDARKNKLEAWLSQNIDPYPAAVQRSHTCAQTSSKDGIAAVVVGRIRAWRGHGKLQFCDIADESGKLQLAFKADRLNATQFVNLELFDIGDFIQASGTTFTTKSGERTLEVTGYQILVKTTKPLPNTWYGLKDTEDRYRRRYLDLLLNPEVKQRLTLRSQIIASIRDYLNTLGFVEVETPTLQPIYGGGFARPFKTHHNVLNADLYLRISDEMYLKRLIVGGFEKVYEITKVFRNEGIDFDHNPEFTMFEAQIAFKDYTYGMDLIEEIIQHTAQKVFGRTKLDYRETEIEVKRPWRRLTYVAAIKEYTGLDPLAWECLEQAKTDAQTVKDIPPEKMSELNKCHSLGEVTAFVFEEAVEAKLIQPTIIYDYPIEISPLAKKCPDPRFTQRFEMFAFGSELGNNYTELNDPIDLKKRFVDEKKREAAGFAEAHQTDYDYLEAIEHGFPPTCGIAIGIDRLVMLFTDAPNIKEVIAFPLLKPQAGPTITDTQPYDYTSKKIVLIVDDALPAGKIANAIGHLAFAGGHNTADDWFERRELADASGQKHPGIAKYPVIVLKAPVNEIAEIRTQALEAGIQVRDYPKAMFTTAHDNELAQKLSKQTNEDITYHALLLTGDTAQIDPITQHLPKYS